MMSEEAQIVASDGILDTLGEHLRSAGLDGKVFVISDRQVWSHVGPTLALALTTRGFVVRTKTIAGGEHRKTLREAEALYTWLAAERAERRDTIVALGGGVVGDLVGFVAATYLRGVALVQVPTSVLAQVDSAIGGKTAVDLPAGKNLVGAFHEARITLIDTRTLDTLPVRDLRAGWAEVLKTTLLFDPPLFERLEGYDATDVPADLRREVVARCANWKQKLVREDPQGARPADAAEPGAHHRPRAGGRDRLHAVRPRRGGRYRPRRGGVVECYGWWSPLDRGRPDRGGPATLAAPRAIRRDHAGGGVAGRAVGQEGQQVHHALGIAGGDWPPGHSARRTGGRGASRAGGFAGGLIRQRVGGKACGRVGPHPHPLSSQRGGLTVPLRGGGTIGGRSTDRRYSPHRNRRGLSVRMLSNVAADTPDWRKRERSVRSRWA